MSVSTLVTLSLDADEVADYLEAAAIIYGDERYAIISEIGLVSGVDKILTSGGINYNEVVDAQITTHITDYHALRYSNNGLTLVLDVGAVEPLLITSAGP
jgi:hydrogenase maturation factor HypF (carbamoyltransferase family)